MLALPWKPRHFATGRMNSKPGIVRDPGHRDDVVPVRAPAFGREAHRQAAVAIGAEHAELEAVRSEQRVVGAGWVHVRPVTRRRHGRHTCQRCYQNSCDVGLY